MVCQFGTGAVQDLGNLIGDHDHDLEVLFDPGVAAGGRGAGVAVGGQGAGVAEVKGVAEAGEDLAAVQVIGEGAVGDLPGHGPDTLLQMGGTPSTADQDPQEDTRKFWMRWTRS